VQAVILTRVALAGGSCTYVARSMAGGPRSSHNSSYVQQRDSRWHCGYFYVKSFSAQVPGSGTVTVEVAFIDTSPWCVRRGVASRGVAPELRWASFGEDEWGMERIELSHGRRSPTVP
jgi:hypothetical protein